MNAGTCVHYTGCLGNDRCKRGVSYRVNFGQGRPGIMNRLPCVEFIDKPAGRPGSRVKPGEETVRVPIDRHGDTVVPCPLREEPTIEQVEADRAETEAVLQRILTVMPVVAEWRKKEPRGKAGVIECPACGGRLHLTQAASNGHVWGKCETKGCVSWME